MSFPRLTFLYLPLVLGLALLTGACAVPLAVTAGSYAADGGLMVASNKTATDHLASMVSKQDCALWRVFRGRKVCKEREGDKDPYAVDYNGPQRSVSEDGVVQYGPPLRPAPDAPAMSWDAAAYKAAPAEPAPAEPEPAPAEPTRAVADAAPAPAPAATAAPPAAPKAKKSKVARSAKKPSRGQVASAP